MGKNRRIDVDAVTAENPAQDDVPPEVTIAALLIDAVPPAALIAGGAYTVGMPVRP
jgi:hypothetical protein